MKKTNDHEELIQTRQTNKR